MSYEKEQQRINKIKKKYGANIFKTWGEEGGNPVLIAQGKGYKISIHKKRK
jgi:hypothetical protein